MIKTNLTNNIGGLTPHEAIILGSCIVAMADSNLIGFKYDGKERVVEVHAVGRSTKDGSLVLRGFQVAGDASRPLPQWTLFTVAKIELATFGVDDTQSSLAPRDGYTMDDKQMAPVLCQLDLG